MNAPLRATVVVALAALSAVPSTNARGADPPVDEADPDEPQGADAGAPTLSTPSRGEPKRVGDGRDRERERDGMVSLPGGTFTMGSADAAAPSNERPPHGVTIKPFWIDRTEVTVGAYRACVSERQCPAPAKTSVQCTYPMGDADLPVSCVRWADAEAFCRSRKKRLPTEAEWEFAARGTTTAIYPWGGTRSSCTVAATLVRDTTALSCSGPRPSKVGTHPAGSSGFGVQDLSGNVEEWVGDYYSEHRATAAPGAGASRVLRGGGWLSAPSASRTTTRNWGSVTEAGPNVGFRCARDG